MLLHLREVSPEIIIKNLRSFEVNIIWLVGAVIEFSQSVFRGKKYQFISYTIKTKMLDWTYANENLKVDLDVKNVLNAIVTCFGPMQKYFRLNKTTC